MVSLYLQLTQIMPKTQEEPQPLTETQVLNYFQTTAHRQTLMQ
jgi:hypothetical protein